jgi:hypothetical protein
VKDPTSNHSTATDDTLPPRLDLDFEAIDEGGDEFLDRELFQIRESLADFRNL